MINNDWNEEQLCNSTPLSLNSEHRDLLVPPTHTDLLSLWPAGQPSAQTGLSSAWCWTSQSRLHSTSFQGLRWRPTYECLMFTIFLEGVLIYMTPLPDSAGSVCPSLCRMQRKIKSVTARVCFDILNPEWFLVKHETSERNYLLQVSLDFV